MPDSVNFLLEVRTGTLVHYVIGCADEYRILADEGTMCGEPITDGTHPDEGVAHHCLSCGVLHETLMQGGTPFYASDSDSDRWALWREVSRGDV